MTDTDLKPCPFCGGEAQLIKLTDIDVKVSCISNSGWCDAEVQREDADTCIEAWNTRTHGWQPIETAPKDGTGFIAYSPTHGIKTPVSWNKDYRRFDKNGYSSLKNDWTHWMPLPNPPEEQV